MDLKYDSIGYVRMARKAKDSCEGVLYICRWPTGAEELIFHNHEAAARRAARTGALYYGPALIEYQQTLAGIREQA